MKKEHYIEEAPLSRFLFSNKKIAWLWLVVRMYVGWQWVAAGWEKVTSQAWVGGNAGPVLKGFVQGALAKTPGAHPDVSNWYAWFLQYAVLPHAHAWSHLIAYGELLVGVALILGLLTGIAAFFGLFMNLNYLLAGTVSINPILFILTIGIILAWRVSGYIGLDHYLLPLLGVPWKKGNLFEESAT